jgi:hypothetical protein
MLQKTAVEQPRLTASHEGVMIGCCDWIHQ